MDDKKYFCIRGFMKSGTNWLGSLMNSHESISVNGEFHFQHLVSPLNVLVKKHVSGYSKIVPGVRQEFQTFLKKVMLQAADPTATLIGDRTPHTIAPVTLKDAKYISIVRDGRDVLVSRIFHLFNNPKTYRLFDKVSSLKKLLESFQENPWFFNENPATLLNHERTVRDSCRLWRNHMEVDRNAIRNHPDLEVKFVRYEDLHADTEGKRKELFEFLEVDPKRCADLDGVLKPGFKAEKPDQFLRKGAVGDWKNYFNPKVAAWFKEEAGEELITQGYESDLNW